MLFYWLSISSPYRLSKDWTLGLLTTFHANTPDVKRFFQVMYLPLLTFRLKICSLYTLITTDSTFPQLRMVPEYAADHWRNDRGDEQLHGNEGFPTVYVLSSVSNGDG